MRLTGFGSCVQGRDRRINKVIHTAVLCVYSDYMEVGIRELKAHLSEYVDKAVKGEVIVVTRRGKSVARLTGLTGMSMIEQGIREG